MVTITKSCR